MRLWLARHAQPLVAPGTCYGATDVAADPEQTQAAARALAQAVPTRLRVACSPRLRCAALAQALQALRPELAVTCDPRLAEMDFGSWENRRWDAIGQAAIDAWTADFALHRCGGGESVNDLLQRVASALDNACEGADDMLWITHAGVERAVRVLLAQPPSRLTADRWPRAGLGFGAHACIALDAPTVRARLRENAHARGCA